MSPRRKPAFQDFQEFSEPVPYQREGDFQRGGGRWGSEPVPKERKSLSLISEELSELSEPVPYQGSFQKERKSLSLINEELSEPVPYQGEPVPCNWGRFRSWCGIRVKVKTGSGTNSAKMTQLVSEKGSSKELFRHRRA
jgi:hypothetical protein